MDPDLIHKVIEATRADNERLLTLMEDSCAQSVREDQRWWSPDAFSEYRVESPDPQPIAPEALEEICVAMAHAIHRLKTTK